MPHKGVQAIAGCHYFSLHCIGSLSVIREFKKKEEEVCTQIGKGVNKTVYSVIRYYLHIKHQQIYKKAPTTSEFSKVTVYKVNIQNSVVFLCTSSKQLAF